MISKIILLQLTPNPLRWSCTIDIPNLTIGPTQNEKTTGYYKYGILYLIFLHSDWSRFTVSEVIVTGQ